ncbi:MAG: DUF5689 domain-containing protein [Bacteroidota bacterium]
MQSFRLQSSNVPQLISGSSAPENANGGGKRSNSPLGRSGMGAILLLVAMLFSFNACVFEDFDEPPLDDLVRLTGNITIAELKALHTIGTDPTAIPAGSLLSATVVGNDVSGNIFKELYVEDASGGLVMRIDVNGLNALYPVGTPLIINLDDLYIGDFNTKYQLTIVGGDRIPQGILSDVLLYNALPGETIEVMPRTITLDQLDDDATFADLQNTLVRIEGLQFIDSDAGVPFADVPGERDLNRTLRDCFGNTIVTRTSRFSDFAANNTPTGNGTVIALVDAFGSTRQLKIREEADFMLTEERCGISVGGTLISIADLRSQFTGSETTVSADTKIRGIVISDYTTNNVNGLNLFLQDGNAGIVVRFTDDHTFGIGTELEVSVSGATLDEFNGLLQVSGVPLGNAGDQGPTDLPAPREVTVAEINANAEAWESTLVQVMDATLSGGATIGGNLTVDDGTGTVSLFTFNSATFAGSAVPTGEVNVTAIVSDFGGPQIVIRSGDDIEGGMTGTGGDPEEISLAELRALYNNGSTLVPANRFITGVVVSDFANMNTTGRNVVIQNGESGIVARFLDNHVFALGEAVTIDVGGVELSDFNGLLQVNNVPNANATSDGMGMAPTPRVVTISEIIANGSDWESTVVQIEDATISGGSVFDGALSVSDGTATITIFTRGAASFSNEAIPSGEVTLTAVVSTFNTTQVFIRNLDDIE